MELVKKFFEFLGNIAYVVFVVFGCFSLLFAIVMYLAGIFIFP